AGDRGRGPAAGDPLVGGMVELASPGRDDQAVRQVVHGPEHAAAAVVDGGRHPRVVHRFVAGARACRQPAPRSRQGLGRAHGRGAGSDAMSYLPYVIGAYAVFAVVLLWDYLSPRL